MTAVPRALDLDELEAALAKATPGPWRVEVRGGQCGGTDEWWSEHDVVCGGQAGFTVGDDESAEADAALIVAAVNALPDLIAELRKHRAAVQAVETLARGWRSTASPLGLQLAGDDLHLVLSSAFGAEGADRG
jgi:hypothetical protein